MLHLRVIVDPPGDPSRRRSRPVISVTTVPAVGFTAVAGILGHWEVAAQLALNPVGVVLAGVLVLVLRPRGNVIPRSAQT